MRCEGYVHPQRHGARAGDGETVGVTETRVCEQAPYMSRTGFEQACSEREFFERAPNRGAVGRGRVRQYSVMTILYVCVHL